MAPAPQADAGAVESQEVASGRSGVQPRGPFWSRIDQGKWFGGLCLGIAVRGDFRVDWVRTIGIFLALVTGGLIGIVYLALLLFVPRVETVDEYPIITVISVVAGPLLDRPLIVGSNWSLAACPSCGK